MKKIFTNLLFILLLSSSGLLAQTAGDYRTRASGNWNSIGTSGTWERWSGSAWLTLTQSSQVPSNTNANIVTVRSGHSVTVNNNYTIDQLVLENSNSASIVISANRVLTIANGTGDDLTFTSGANNPTIQVSGRLSIQDGSVVTNSTASRLLIFASGILEFNYATTPGTIPTANWSTSSTLSILGYTTNTTSPSGLSQSFYNLTWNCPSQTTTVDLAGNLTTVRGDLTIDNTGTGIVNLSVASTNALTISGSLNVNNSAKLSLGQGTTSISFDINIGNLATFTGGSTSNLTLAGSDYNMNLPAITNGVGILSLQRTNSVFTISSNFIVADDLDLQTGELNIDAYTLYLGSTITSTAGLLAGGTTSSIFLDGTGDATLPSISGGLSTLSLGREGYTVTVGAALTVYNFVNVYNGTLASGGNLTVDLNTGGINKDGSGAISGDVNVYKTTNPLQYIASPLSDVTVAQLTDEVLAIPLGQSLYYYNETSTNIDKGIGWTGISSASDILTPGVGYALYNTPSSVDITGTYDHTASPTVNITYTSSGNSDADGWNLLGNPFPSTLDWTGVTHPTANDAIYYRDYVDATTSRFATYIDGVGVNGGTQYIPAMQSFWVKATGDGTVTFDRAARYGNDAQPLYRKGATAENILRLTVINEHNSDETLIRFKENSTLEFDSKKDAYKFANSGLTPSLYTFLGKTNFSINTVPELKDTLSIPLLLNAKRDGIYSISATDISSFTEDFGPIYLIDKQLGKKQNLKEYPQYTAMVKATEAASGRFFINFEKNSNTITGNINLGNGRFYLYNNLNTLTAKFEGINSKFANISINNLQGDKVLDLSNADISSGIINIETSLTTGLYLVKIITNEKTYVQKVFFNK